MWTVLESPVWPKMRSFGQCMRRRAKFTKKKAVKKSWESRMSRFIIFATNLIGRIGSKTYVLERLKALILVFQTPQMMNRLIPREGNIATRVQSFHRPLRHRPLHHCPQHSEPSSQMSTLILMDLEAVSRIWKTSASVSWVLWKRRDAPSRF